MNGLSKYPLLALGVGIFLISYAIVRLKKDSKSVLGTCISIGFGGILLAIAIYNDTYKFLSIVISNLNKALIVLLYMIGYIFMFYNAWNNKNDPKAKTKVKISVALMLLAGVLLLIACLL